MKKKRLLTLILVAAFYVLGLSGCATVPKQGQFPAYTINGTDYYSLVSLCEAKGITYEYDEFARVVNLSGNNHRLTLKVGDGLLLIDGRPLKFEHPVDLYQGMIVVPRKIKEQALDRFFKDVAATPPAAARFSKLRKIVLDPGHGGYDPGAIGKSGLKEKDINLDIAKRLHNILKSEGVEVVMTRSDDTFISLGERARIANSCGAELFLSIHSNANRVKSLSGFEAYYINPDIGDVSRSLNSAKNDRLYFSEGCFDGVSTEVKAILWDMIYTHARAEAIELGSSICRSAQKNLGVEVLGVKKGRYAVLRNTRIPAVLIETGFLSNSQEERMLNNGYYRQKLAEAIAEGVSEYGEGAVIMEAAAR